VPFSPPSPFLSAIHYSGVRLVGQLAGRAERAGDILAVWRTRARKHDRVRRILSRMSFPCRAEGDNLQDRLRAQRKTRKTCRFERNVTLRDVNVFIRSYRARDNALLRDSREYFRSGRYERSLDRERERELTNRAGMQSIIAIIHNPDTR